MSDAPNVRPFMLAANQRFVRRLILEHFEESTRTSFLVLLRRVLEDGMDHDEAADMAADEIAAEVCELLTPDDEAP